MQAKSSASIGANKVVCINVAPELTAGRPDFLLHGA